MDKIQKLNGNQIGLPRTPSHWVDDVEYIKVHEILISCGGGMGGKSYYEYVLREDEIPSNQLIEFTRYDGKKILINTKHIVSVENFTLGIADFYSENPNFPKGFDNVQYLVEDGVEIKLVDRYQG